MAVCEVGDVKYVVFACFLSFAKFEAEFDPTRFHANAGVRLLLVVKNDFTCSFINLLFIRTKNGEQ